MRSFIVMLLTLASGVGIAFLLARLVAHWFPKQFGIVFVLVSLWWLWTGWKYASARDRGQF